MSAERTADQARRIGAMVSSLWSEIVAAPQSLDDECSRHFTWRMLVECGPHARLSAAGITLEGPHQVESWRMLAGLAQEILDPVVDHFGPVELTYGFCGPSMAAHLKGRTVAPSLDQHAAAEINQRRHPICRRGGAAADFSVAGRSARELARWITAHLPFDRLYFYGPVNSLHVSWHPRPVGRAWAMVKGLKGRRLPRPYTDPLGDGEGNS